MSQEPARDDRVAHGTHPRRVLLKLSGEVFGGGSIGLDPDVVSDAARQIAEAVRAGVQVSVVVGGGNFFRGAELSSRGMDRARAEDDDAVLLHVADGAQGDVGLGDLSHGDGGLDTGGHPRLLNEVLQGQGVHDGSQHAHVVGAGAVHAA